MTAVWASCELLFFFSTFLRCSRLSRRIVDASMYVLCICECFYGAVVCTSAVSSTRLVVDTLVSKVCVFFAVVVFVVVVVAVPVDVTSAGDQKAAVAEKQLDKK